MYIWLKGTIEEAQNALDLGLKEGRQEKIRVHADYSSGQPYVNGNNPIDPTSTQPSIPSDLIDHVTWRDRIYRGLRKEGLYELKGARLLVKTTVDFKLEFEKGEIKDESQEISIRAPSIAILVEIHSQFRRGELKPVENWEVATT